MKNWSQPTKAIKQLKKQKDSNRLRYKKQILIKKKKQRSEYQWKCNSRKSELKQQQKKILYTVKDKQTWVLKW